MMTDRHDTLINDNGTFSAVPNVVLGGKTVATAMSSGQVFDRPLSPSALFRRKVLLWCESSTRTAHRSIFANSNLMY